MRRKTKETRVVQMITRDRLQKLVSDAIDHMDQELLEAMNDGVEALWVLGEGDKNIVVELRIVPKNMNIQPFKEDMT